MPRIVRNFWLEGGVDGRDSAIGTGPRSKSGGMKFTIYQRDDGSICGDSISIHCYERNGVLTTRVAFAPEEGLEETLLELKTCRDTSDKSVLKNKKIGNARLRSLMVELLTLLKSEPAESKKKLMETIADELL